MLLRQIKFCSDDVKHLLFKTYCSNMYSCHLWSVYLKSSYSKLRVAYNNICRYMLNLDRYCSKSTYMVENGIKTTQEIIRNYMYSFYTKLSDCDNVARLL